ncbi:MAG: hypothetical protein SFV21_09700 [Rhodospirillaceae bacterium]|nr:hypothetical protein [Rhodospirillaceae bacterium]
MPVRSALLLAATLMSAAAGAAEPARVHMMTTPNEVPGTRQIEAAASLGAPDATLEAGLQRSRTFADRARMSENRAAALANLCVGHALKGEYALAQTYCDRAVEEPRHAAIALVNRGALHILTGNSAAAVVDLERALALAPGLAEARNNLDRAQVKLAAAQARQNVAETPRE